MIWSNPWAFSIPVIALLLAVYYGIKRKFDYSEIQFIELSSAMSNWKTAIKPFLPILYCIALGLFGVALARPQYPLSDKTVKTEGIDIVLALDISPSMLAKDFKPNRLEAAKEVAKEFIEGRPNDRIGLVLFAGEAFTHCPLTIDHDILIRFLDDVKVGMLTSGTAIGSGLGTAVNRLKDSPGKSKVVLLMTDGVNNSGEIDPVLAASLAQQTNIRVHTIGVGTMGEALFPVGIMPDGRYQYDMAPVEIDEELLQYISNSTTGEYFRATDNSGLRRVYQQIDEMETTRIELSSVQRMEEHYYPWVLAGLICLVIPFLLNQTLLKSVN